jgi:hypothetical protein
MLRHVIMAIKLTVTLTDDEAVALGRVMEASGFVQQWTVWRQKDIELKGARDKIWEALKTAGVTRLEEWSEEAS